MTSGCPCGPRYPAHLGAELEDLDEFGRDDEDRHPIVGDRLYAVTDRNEKLGSGKTSRRFRRLDGLFDLRARDGGERPIVTLPDGRELSVGDAELDAFLSERYGDELRVLHEDRVPHHDAAPLHLLTTSSVRWLGMTIPASQIDARRFRPNVLLETSGDALVEDAWVGRRLALGEALLGLQQPVHHQQLAHQLIQGLATPTDRAPSRATPADQGRADTCQGPHA
jgi:uncharacterized protein YcbX